MPDFLDALNASNEVRAAHHVAYSLHMLAEITANYDGAVDDDQFLTARCMVDTFYVHLRLMADFLVKTTKHDDNSPADFGVRWTKPDAPEVENLRGYHDDASKYVVHFGRPRVPDSLEDLTTFEIGGGHRRKRLTDVVAVFGCFLAELESNASAWDQDSLLPDREREPDTWKLRLRWDQSQILRQAFDEARVVCDL